MKNRENRNNAKPHVSGRRGFKTKIILTTKNKSQMTTKDFIKKTQQILSKKLTVTQITFQQRFNIDNELPKKVEEQMYVTVFYKKSDGRETNFTVNSYDWSDHYGIEELLVKVKEHLAGMEEIKSHTTEPEIESALSK